MKNEHLKLNDPIVTKLLKDVYLPMLEAETWNNAGALSEGFGLMNIGKTVNAETGKLDVYVKKGGHGSVGAFGDDYTFDSAVQKLTGDEMVVRTRGFQANARIDVIPNQRLNSSAAIENVFSNQFEELSKKLQKNYSRMLYGDGSGEITQVKGAVTAATGLIDVPVVDVRSFEIGDIISIEKAENTVDAPKGSIKTGVERVNEPATDGGIKETSYNRSATFGPDQDNSSRDSDKITTHMIVDIDDIAGIITIGDEKGKANASISFVDKAAIYYRRSINQDIHGLKYIVGDKGYYGLGETVYGKGDGQRPKYMKSYVETLSNNYLTEYDFMKAIDLQERRGADMTMNMVVTSRGTRASIASTNQGASTGIVRLMRDASSTAANDQRSMGYQGVDLKGQAVEVDRFATKGDIWFLDMSGFNFAVESEMRYDDFDGNIWKQVTVTSGTTAGSKNSRVLSYEANMYAYKELFNFKPRTLGLIKIADPVHVTPTITNTTAVDYE